MTRQASSDADLVVCACVLPEWRRRGLGSEILDRCLAHARALQAVTVLGTVHEDDAEALEFLMRRGFVVTERVVSQALELESGLPPPAVPEGIEIAELEEGRLEEAYEVFAKGVVGLADLEPRNAEAGLIENNLTTVVRSHRRRGIAEALKRSQIAWAVANGYRTLATATLEANEPMRRLNEKLGFRPLSALLDVTLRLVP